MAPEEEVGVSRKRRRKDVPETGPYILRTLVENVPLASEGDASDIEISCVELWEGNLYIGTSAAEILHLVLIPPDSTDTAALPTFILASRLQPAFTPTVSGQKLPGVQQILVLPRANKACVLCNGVLTFYSLPELSPAFATTKVANCAWVGGVDQNSYDGGVGSEGEVVMISIRSKIRLVHIGDQIRVMKNIDYAGSLLSARRDAFACVADAHTYALLDVDHQQKIPLFPISSLDEAGETGTGGQAVNISSSGPSGVGATLSDRPLSADLSGDARGHGRSTSLGAFVSGLGRRQESPRPRSSDRTGLQTPEPTERASSPARAASPNPSGERISSMSTAPPPPEKSLPQLPVQEPSSRKPQSQRLSAPLKPHVLSPSPTEFLLTTGTVPSEPGVGMFVNLDGDVVRGTVEFAQYPDSLVVDGRGVGVEMLPSNADEDEGGYVLAVMERSPDSGGGLGLECQRWDVDPGEPSEKSWLEVVIKGDDRESGEEPGSSLQSNLGIRTTISYSEIPIAEICAKLQQHRIRLTQSHDSVRELPLEQWETERNTQEAEFARRFGRLRSRVAVWSGSHVWWAVRNPLAVRLDSQLELAGTANSGKDEDATLDRRKVVSVVNGLRGKEPRTETEFLSLNYIRQKAGLLLFMELIECINRGLAMEKSDKRATEEAMMEGSVDPRIIVALIPFLRHEVVEGLRGVWIFGGVKEVAEMFIMQQSATRGSYATADTPQTGILDLVRRYLLAWRRKKGFGSVADEEEVFRTVDAALLRVLLQLDLQSPKGPAALSSIRAELNAFIDSGVSCFDRAVLILEESQRLYILSRLYQSRKMARDVLATWTRIIDGETDDGGEFDNGENKVREYLTTLRDVTLVEEFGTWLARRNPKIGVRVFADDSSRVKLEPSRVVKLLGKGAPGAVKDYLEHLVFGQNNTRYVNDLIFFYLDSVLTTLKTSTTARSTLAQTYKSYRALRPPKPTYRQFITDNVIDEEWWQSRLRLLQLLGGSRGAAANYDVSAIRERVEPYEQELVPEMIILDGRQARHPQAIRLLTHGLGDFDTAINYCLMGGSSIFHPMSGRMRPDTVPSREEQAILFSSLLSEFLQIEDINDRIERTGELLERFGGWLDVGQVLKLIPDSWSVELVSGFLISALRRLVREKNESMVAKALSGAENLRITSELIGKCDEAGPTVEAAE